MSATERRSVVHILESQSANEKRIPDTERLIARISCSILKCTLVKSTDHRGTDSLSVFVLLVFIILIIASYVQRQHIVIHFDVVQVRCNMRRVNAFYE